VKPVFRKYFTVRHFSITLRNETECNVVD